MPMATINAVVDAINAEPIKRNSQLTPPKRVVIANTGIDPPAAANKKTNRPPAFPNTISRSDNSVVSNNGNVRPSFSSAIAAAAYPGASATMANTTAANITYEKSVEKAASSRIDKTNESPTNNAIG